MAGLFGGVAESGSRPLTRRIAAWLAGWLAGWGVLAASLGGAVGATEEPNAARGAKFQNLPEVRFPVHSMIVNVTQAPYHAKGDGVTDDTDALQRALADVMGQHKLLYFPSGTYLVSKTLMWSKKNSNGRDAWGKNFLQGQHVHQTVIRLKDGTFPDPGKPGAIMWCGGFGSADWFHNYVQDLTFDVGENNAGAIGLQFYSNNSGAVRNCRFLAPAGSGLVGLDLGHRDMNGPLLVRNCEVVGFARGVATARGVNSQTFEHLSLRGQTRFGFTNEGQPISIRSLRSENRVPTLQTYGTLCLIEADLIGQEGAAAVPAIVNFNGGRLYLRDIKTSGYRRALGDVVTPDSAAAYRITGPDKPGSQGPEIAEYWSHQATRAFPAVESRAASAVLGQPGSLRLPIEEPPVVSTADPSTWANVDDFGADPTGQADSAAAMQKAVDSGASTLFLPGTYALKSTVIIRGNVRHVIGIGGIVDYFSQSKPDFRIVDDRAEPLVWEHFAYIHGGIEIDTKRTIYFRSVADCPLTFTPRAAGGNLFLEDFVTHHLQIRDQRVWARQLNIENEGTHLVNDRSNLWVLGYKTERGGTLLDARPGSQSEILGGFSYTTTAGKLAPMFVVDNCPLFAFFAEVCYNGDPYVTLIRETRGNSTRELRRGEGDTIPYLAGP